MMISSPNAKILSIGTQAANKSKIRNIRNKLTQTVNVITYNMISTQAMPHNCTCLKLREKGNISKSGVRRTE